MKTTKGQRDQIRADMASSHQRDPRYNVSIQSPLLLDLLDDLDEAIAAKERAEYGELVALKKLTDSQTDRVALRAEVARLRERTLYADCPNCGRELKLSAPPREAVKLLDQVPEMKEQSK